MNNKFYLCKHCGNIVGMIHSAGVPLYCCGEKMEELKANTSDGATEKHIPVIEMHDGLVKVTVGSVEHPMTQEHNIAWVYVKTNQGGHRKDLIVGQSPKVEFALCQGEELLEVYAYCNLHGLWVAEA